MSALKDSKHLKIPFKQIEVATRKFQECIGKGGYGMVYKGQLSVDGKSKTVAVKRLNEQFGQGLKEFLMEIQLLTDQNHRNLISLVGYCDEGNEKMIVYEYAEHGSLDQYLRRNNTFYALTWLERLKICVDAARGLDHLHNHVGEHLTIIHRDIKSSNILLDGNWVAKISDLGLSKLSLSGFERSVVVSYACGTRGYCEPEYFSTGIVKKESDVYSFGVVLYEVFCGKLCFVDDGTTGFLLSGPLAKDYYLKNKVSEIVDPGVRNQMSLESMNRFATIAYYCLHDDREKRPTMDLVTKELEELLQIQISSYSLETPHETSLSMKAGTDEMLWREMLWHQGFDRSLQVRADSVISNMDSGVEDRSMLFDVEKEVALFATKMNRDIRNNLKLVNLVKDYREINTLTIGLCDSLSRCLKRVRETHLLILEALRHFDDEDGVEENKYDKAIQDLKSFKAARDPFTQDFFRILNINYRQQIGFHENLQREKTMLLCKKLDQTWLRKRVNSVTKGYNNIEVQEKVMSFMEVVSYIGMKDIGRIEFLVNRLQMDIGNFTRNAEFAIKMKDAVKYVIENMTEKLKTFLKNVEELEELANICTANIQKACGI